MGGPAKQVGGLGTSALAAVEHAEIVFRFREPRADVEGRLQFPLGFGRFSALHIAQAELVARLGQVRIKMDRAFELPLLGGAVTELGIGE